MKVEIYTKPNCPYCTQAKKLLDKKGVKYTEIHIENDAAKREEMITRSGRYTVPQIFINGQSIGGYDDLYTLDRTGKLDQLLKSQK